MVLQRVVIVVLAVAVVAWAAVSFRDAVFQARARNVLTSPRPTHEQIRAALSDVRRSRALNPDRSEPLLLTGLLETNRGHYGSARDALLKLVRAEPENRDAWIVLELISEGRYPRLAAHAEARIRELDPLGAREVGP